MAKRSYSIGAGVGGVLGRQSQLARISSGQNNDVAYAAQGHGPPAGGLGGAKPADPDPVVQSIEIVGDDLVYPSFVFVNFNTDMDTTSGLGTATQVQNMWVFRYVINGFNQVVIYRPNGAVWVNPRRLRLASFSYSGVGGTTGRGVYTQTGPNVVKSTGGKLLPSSSVAIGALPPCAVPRPSYASFLDNGPGFSTAYVQFDWDITTEFCNAPGDLYQYFRVLYDDYSWVFTEIEYLDGVQGNSIALYGGYPDEYNPGTGVFLRLSFDPPAQNSDNVSRPCWTPLPFFEIIPDYL